MYNEYIETWDSLDMPVHWPAVLPARCGELTSIEEVGDEISVVGRVLVKGLGVVTDDLPSFCQQRFAAV